MSVIDTVKEVAFLVQKLDNLDLLKRMVELQEQVFALVGENRDVKEENRLLQERLNTRSKMMFRDNAYWTDDTIDGPFCSRCFDAEGLLMRMLTRKGYAPRCPKCSTVAPDPDREPPQPRVVRSSWLNR